MASIVEPMLEPSPQSRPHIDEVKKKLETLWSNIDNTEKSLIPIKYAKPLGKMGPDFWARTTTNTLTLDELIN
jgi:hypothetical protein